MTKLRKDRPGYKYRVRADGSIAHYWDPRRASSKAPKILTARPIADEATDAMIADLCQRWTDELLADLETIDRTPAFDGTVSSLIHLYRTDELSPYHQIKHSTRVRDYDPSLRLVDRTVGKRQIASLKGEDFRRWYAGWASSGRIRRAHGAIRKVRTIFAYGVTQRMPGCSAAREILSLMEFAAPATRQTKMEFDQAKAICDAAIAAQPSRPSIALVQALQWDTGLRRIHIIGEWLPVKEGDKGGIIRGKTKWNGLTATDIVDNVLTVPNLSKNKSASRHDLGECHLLQYVLGKGVELPKIGPIAVSEVTGLPYRENYYATDWRTIATAAKVPADVWSMDTRAGAISEAEQVTDLDSARKMAAHTDAKTTLGYVRSDDLDNNRKVAKARSQIRK
jgi:hypothetical protein